MELKVSNSPTSLVPPPISRKPHPLTVLFIAILFAGAAYYLFARSLNQRAQLPPKGSPTGKSKVGSPKSKSTQDCNREAQKLYDKGFENRNNIALAFNSFKDALNCNPTDPELLGKIHCWLGNCYSRKKEYDQAITSHSQAISLELRTSVYAISLLKRGKLYDFQKQNLKNAIEDYEAVIRCVSQNSKQPDPILEILAHLLKSSALCRQVESSGISQKNVALQEIELAFDMAKTHDIPNTLKVEIHYQRALCHHLLGDFSKASVDYYEASEQDGAKPYMRASILCDQALCYETNNQQTVALQYYEEASQIEFSDLDPHESLHGISRTPLRTPTEGTPASYKNSAELRATIESGKARMGKYRTPHSSPNKTYFQTPQRQPQSP